MQERQVTIEGLTHPLERPFLVLATQNPIEYEGTYPLPEAQLDRFLIRLGVGYPEREDEWQVLVRRMEREVDEIELTPVVDGETLLRDAARARAGARLGAGRPLHGRPRRRDADVDARAGRSVAARNARAAASSRAAARRSHGRDFVTPDDVKAVAVPALAHRLTLRPELWVQRVSGEDLVREALDSVPTPPRPTA